MRGGRCAALLLLVAGCSFESGAPGSSPAAGGPDAAIAPPPEPLHLRVTAFIDGRSRLILSGSQVQWFHLDYSAPGRLNGANLPTTLDGVDWWPSWPDDPDPENRDCGCRSLDAWGGLTVPVPRAASNTTVTPVDMRGAATVVEQATAANDFAVVVELDDNGDAGAETYVVDIDVEPL